MTTPCRKSISDNYRHPPGQAACCMSDILSIRQQQQAHSNMSDIEPNSTTQTEGCQCCICREHTTHYDLAILCRGGCGSLVGFPLSWKLDTTATTTEIERLAWCSKCAAVLSAEGETNAVIPLPDNSNAATGQPEGKATIPAEKQTISLESRF